MRRSERDLVRELCCRLGERRAHFARASRCIARIETTVSAIPTRPGRAVSLIDERVPRSRARRGGRATPRRACARPVDELSRLALHPRRSASSRQSSTPPEARNWDPESEERHAPRQQGAPGGAPAPNRAVTMAHGAEPRSPLLGMAAGIARGCRTLSTVARLYHPGRMGRGETPCVSPVVIVATLAAEPGVVRAGRFDPRRG